MKQRFILLFHIGYWSFYLAVLLLVFFAAQVGLATPPKHILVLLGAGASFVMLPSLMGFYTAYYILFDKYLEKRSILALIGFGAVTLIALTLICGILMSLISDEYLRFGITLESLGSSIALIAGITIVNGVLGFILKGFVSWYADLKIKEKLQKATHKMELELVKSKLDPHFLFNTINNIDGLMMKDTQVASEYLDKLSTILRFILYESKAEQIPLITELEYIQKYIDLQKIRTTNDDYVKYTIKGRPNNHKIPAMLFIPFIENAFKHVDSKKEFHAIRIQVAIEADQIHFVCQNNFKTYTGKPKEVGGVGNELIAKRLALLYPDRHQLKTTVIDETYAVELTILTNEN